MWMCSLEHEGVVDKFKAGRFLSIVIVCDGSSDGPAGMATRAAATVMTLRI